MRSASSELSCKKIMLGQFDPFVVSVPATTANLGAGFDSIGMALDLRMRADVRPASAFSLSFEPGPAAPTHDGLARMIRESMGALLPELPAADVHVNNRIPLGKGLGSSAAAVVLGLAIARRCGWPRIAQNSIARLASSIEGHPDNALAALYGGIVIAASRDDRAPVFVRLRADAALRALVTVPHVDLSTLRSRAALPQRYDRSDAVFNTQRSALLAAALATGNQGLLQEAMRDRLHQPYRAHLIPGADAALALSGGNILGIALSGAGPSVLTLLNASDGWRATASRVRDCFDRQGVGSTSHYLRISTRGAVVERCRERRTANAKSFNFSGKADS